MTAQEWVATIAEVATAAGFFVAAWALWDTRKAQQLQVADRVFENILNLEANLYQATTAAHVEPQHITQWRSLFLNALEYFAFLVNRGYLADRQLASFFTPAVERWYDEIFVKRATPSELSNEDEFRELKRLYAEIKAGGFVVHEWR